MEVVEEVWVRVSCVFAATPASAPSCCGIPAANGGFCSAAPFAPPRFVPSTAVVHGASPVAPPIHAEARLRIGRGHKTKNAGGLSESPAFPPPKNYCVNARLHYKLQGKPF